MILFLRCLFGFSQLIDWFNARDLAGSVVTHDLTTGYEQIQCLSCGFLVVSSYWCIFRLSVFDVFRYQYNYKKYVFHQGRCIYEFDQGINFVPHLISHTIHDSNLSCLKVTRCKTLPNKLSLLLSTTDIFV
jgi:hypothetical protein